MPDVAWSLPDRPDHPRYAELAKEIRGNPKRQLVYRVLRRVAEVDFYAFCRFVSSFGNFPIRDRGHAHYGRMWVEEPFVFEKCRMLQEHSESREDDVFFNWSRFFFKTELVTKLLSLWELTLDPTLTFALITHKVDQTGHQIFRGPQQEMEQNPLFPALWPATYRRDVKEYPLWTTTQATIIRPPGIREPSFSIHALEQLPDSGHYRRIVVDDGVTAKAVENPRAMAKAERQMRRITPLSQDDTVTRWIGTVWDENDPNMAWVSKGNFSRRDYEPGLKHPEGIAWAQTSSIDDWEPQLRSRSFFTKWRRKMGEYEFSCQVMGAPVARGEQNFDLAWLHEYQNKPKDEAKGKSIHLLIDPAGEEVSGKDSDHWVWRVTGLGNDGNRYQLDLWRERVTLPEAFHLTFALVKHWRPKQVWLEEYTSGYFASFKREMEARSFRFRMRKLPAIKRSKETRIKLLQASYQRGEIWYPAAGFGHGSGPFYIDALRAAVKDSTLEEPRNKVSDRRDTYQQFRLDEYTRWVPIKGAVIHDDMLDTEAWSVQEEVKALMPKPERSDEEAAANYNPHDPALRAGTSGVSAWVY